MKHRPNYMFVFLGGIGVLNASKRTGWRSNNRLPFFGKPPESSCLIAAQVMPGALQSSCTRHSSELWVPFDFPVLCLSSLLVGKFEQPRVFDFNVGFPILRFNLSCRGVIQDRSSCDFLHCPCGFRASYFCSVDRIDTPPEWVVAARWSMI